MKKLIAILILAASVTTATTVKAQDYPDEYLGLPGDNLNLYAVMDLFQNSETIEAFERSLNSQESRINNLDLNGDNLIDYISVYDYVDGNVHTIVLRTALSRYENQDVAVFTVQKFKNGSVQIQLVGDEALYGRNYIIEPNYADAAGERANPGYIGKTRYSNNVAIVSTTYYEVAAWPLVSYIYLPTYVTWHSTWYWGYYPAYWNPWRPFYWHYYYGYHYNYHNHYYSYYRHCNYHRYPRYNSYYYTSIRNYSPQVHVNVSKGQYRNTYSHPEQRREGEALYARDQNDPNRRRVTASTVSYDNRRTMATANSSNRSSAEQGNEISRRVQPNTTERTASRPSPQSNSAVSRTPSNTTNTSSVTRAAGNKNSSTGRSIGQSVNERSAARPATSQSTQVERRPAPANTEKSVARPASTQRTSVSGRPAASVSQKSAPAPSRGQSVNVERRAPSGNSTVSRSAPSPGRASTAGSSRPSGSSTATRSSNSSVPASKGGSSKTSGDNNSSRRK